MSTERRETENPYLPLFILPLFFGLPLIAMLIWHSAASQMKTSTRDSASETATMTTTTGKTFENRTRGMDRWRAGEAHPNGASAYNYVIPRDEMPDLGSASNEDDPLLRVKLFDPTGSWTWYLIEFGDNDSQALAFGYVQGVESELGYIDLNELADLRGAMGLPIERDLHWTPTRLSEIQAKER